MTTSYILFYNTGYAATPSDSTNHSIAQQITSSHLQAGRQKFECYTAWEHRVGSCGVMSPLFPDIVIFPSLARCSPACRSMS